MLLFLLPPLLFSIEVLGLSDIGDIKVSGVPRAAFIFLGIDLRRESLG